MAPSQPSKCCFLKGTECVPLLLWVPAFSAATLRLSWPLGLPTACALTLSRPHLANPLRPGQPQQSRRRIRADLGEGHATGGGGGEGTDVSIERRPFCCLSGPPPQRSGTSHTLRPQREAGAARGESRSQEWGDRGQRERGEETQGPRGRLEAEMPRSCAWKTLSHRGSLGASSGRKHEAHGGCRGGHPRLPTCTVGCSLAIPEDSAEEGSPSGGPVWGVG